jgi:hypothetical protein
VGAKNDLTKVEVWMPSTIADLAMIRANKAGVSRSELIRLLLTEYLES